MANLPQPTHEPLPYGEAVERLSGIRQALFRAEGFGAGPAPDLDSQSDQVVSAAAAGLAALTAVDGDSAASRELVERIRKELAEISNLVLR